jgi:hypothetical protein
MMIEQVFISHPVGWCGVCGAPILDSGYDDDLGKWEHSYAEEERDD